MFAPKKTRRNGVYCKNQKLLEKDGDVLKPNLLTNDVLNAVKNVCKNKILTNCLKFIKWQIYMRFFGYISFYIPVDEGCIDALV